MKWKLLLRKLSISSPEVSVRAQLPGPLRRLLVFLVLALAAAAGVGIYEYGRGLGGPDRRELSAEIERLQLKLREAEAERSLPPRGYSVPAKSPVPATARLVIRGGLDITAPGMNAIPLLIIRQLRPSSSLKKTPLAAVPA